MNVRYKRFHEVANIHTRDRISAKLTDKGFVMKNETTQITSEEVRVLFGSSEKAPRWYEKLVKIRVDKKLKKFILKTDSNMRK